MDELDPVRAFALERALSMRSIAEGAADVVQTAEKFESYLRGSSS